LLTDASKIFRENCITGITVNEEVCKKHVNNSTASVTALIPKTGYSKASEVARLMKEKQITVKEAVMELNLMPPDDFELLISPESVTRLGS
jgi:aspartate ammonia-lyase